MRRRSGWETVIEAFWGCDGREGLERIRVPALVAHGPADRVVPIDVARETAVLIPNAAFVAVERTGHASPVERPEMHNRLLDALIAAALEPEIWPSNVRPWAE